MAQYVEALSGVDPPVPEGHPLYTATGASDGLLALLASRFGIRRQPHYYARGAFMSYSGALVGQLVCAHAERFFGNRYSSFSRKICELRHKRGTFWTGALPQRGASEHGLVIWTSTSDTSEAIFVFTPFVRCLSRR